MPQQQLKVLCRKIGETCAFYWMTFYLGCPNDLSGLPPIRDNVVKEWEKQFGKHTKHNYQFSAVQWSGIETTYHDILPNNVLKVTSY